MYLDIDDHESSYEEPTLFSKAIRVKHKKLELRLKLNGMSPFSCTQLM